MTSSFDLVTYLRFPRSIILASTDQPLPSPGLLPGVLCPSHNTHLCFTPVQGFAGPSLEILNKRQLLAGCWRKFGPPNPQRHQIDPCYSQKVVFPSKNVTLNAGPLSPLRPRSSPRPAWSPFPGTESPEALPPSSPGWRSLSCGLGLSSNSPSSPPQRSGPDHPMYPGPLHHCLPQRHPSAQSPSILLVHVSIISLPLCSLLCPVHKKLFAVIF